jgi:hypothetical protein
MDELEQHLREYVEIMKDEPDEYILISEVYHHLRRILGDEV